MALTKTDRNLLARVGKILREDAEAIAKAHSDNWAATPGAVDAKRRYDRLCREERDLAALRIRLSAG